MCTEKIIFMAGNTHEYVAKEGNCDLFCRRAPHGARGLKQQVDILRREEPRSRPARGVLRILVRRLERTKYGLRRAGDELHLVEDA